MNISFENVSKVQGLLTVNLEKADYQENLEKTLKEYKKKVNMPGFRPGMVPMGLVQRMYGKSVKADEINKLLQDKIVDYIRDNKINMLGEPLPNESAKEQSMDDDDFTFVFDIAIAPEFDASVSSKDKVVYYDIAVSDDMVEGQINSYTQRNGEYEKVEKYADRDMVKGKLTELDADGNVLEGGIAVENATLMPAYFADENAKKLFEGSAKGEEIRFNPSAAYNGNAVQISSLLNRSKEEAADIKSDFMFRIDEITRFVPGELNQELFDKVFGKDAVKSEQEFREKVRKSIELSFLPDSDFRFLMDVRDYLCRRIGKLEFPDELLKRILRANRKEDEKDNIEETYAKSIEELTWHLIKEKLVSANEIRIEDADVQKQAREATRAQFAQYGMMEIPDEMLDSYAKEMLKKRETVDGLVNRAVESKLTEALKNQLTVERKSVSLDEFNKLFEEKAAE